MIVPSSEMETPDMICTTSHLALLSTTHGFLKADKMIIYLCMMLKLTDTPNTVRLIRFHHMAHSLGNSFLLLLYRQVLKKLN